MTVQRWNNFVCAPYLMPDPVVTLSMAPLAHVAERQGVWLTTVFGGSIGFFNGDMARVFDDFAALNPTMHSATPRFYNRIHAEFQATLAAQIAAQPDRAPAESRAMCCVSSRRCSAIASSFSSLAPQ
jgi:long-subunit acyl-CoA synthetase (AMP-forming)